MYHYLVGSVLLKSIDPYFRKHLLSIINTHDYLYLDTIFIFTAVCGVVIYKYIFNKKELMETFQNYKKLSPYHFIGCFFISLFTVISALIIYDLDKHHNTPFINSTILKVASMIALAFIGMFIFKEKYNWRQIVGIVMTLIGVYLIMVKK
jgi:drug/metabolite transporter (DMT)-like permease